MGSKKIAAEGAGLRLYTGFVGDTLYWDRDHYSMCTRHYSVAIEWCC